ncbi:Ada metal-binding domain-containing protein [Planctomycetota bacterium]
MKMKKYRLIIIALVLILSVTAASQVGFPWPNDKLMLSGESEKTLTGIKQLHVFIVPDDNEPNKDGLIWKELDKKVNSKLQQAGIKIADLSYISRPLRAFNAPELRIEIDMIKLRDSQQYVFNIQTFLARTVHFRKKLRLKADVWQTKTIMGAVSAEQMPAAVTKVVTEQIDTFITGYKTANPKGTKQAKIEKAEPYAQKRILPVVKPTTSSHQYVASKKSKIFHKFDCGSAKGIKSANLIGYNSPDEAIRAGKRPCKICKP